METFLPGIDSILTEPLLPYDLLEESKEEMCHICEQVATLSHIAYIEEFTLKNVIGFPNGYKLQARLQGTHCSNCRDICIELPDILYNQKVLSEAKRRLAETGKLIL